MDNKRILSLLLILIVLAVLVLAGVLAGGYRKSLKPSGAQPRESITVAGSTSVQPFAEALAEEFMKKHPDVLINVQGGGSSAGARAALTGVAQIGTLSRELKPDEMRLKPIVIARDAIAVIVHPSNPMKNLSMSQIREIFSGKLTKWSGISLTDVDREIHVITREEGSGTRGAFDELVMGTGEVTPRAVVQDSNGSVRETVADDPGAIGYISLGLVDRRVKALAIDGIAATRQNVLNGKYRIVRPFLFVVMEEPRGEIKDFIDFVLGPEGQTLLASEGLIPAR